MPAKYLSGRRPLNTGLMESRKESEKYVSCMTVIISNVIFLPALKTRDVKRVSKAIATTAYVVFTLML
jgi:hypothetical protein